MITSARYCPLILEQLRRRPVLASSQIVSVPSIPELILSKVTIARQKIAAEFEKNQSQGKLSAQRPESIARYYIDQGLKLPSEYRLLDVIDGGMRDPIMLLKVEDKRNGQICAMKIVQNSAHIPQSLECEWQIAREIGEHQNLLAYHQFGNLTIERNGVSQTCQYLVSEFMDGCTLYDLSATLGEAFVRQPDIQLTLLLDYVNGLERVHKSEVWHRDLRPSNLFVTVGGEGKVFDYGCSIFVSDTDKRECFASDLFGLGKSLYLGTVSADFQRFHWMTSMSAGYQGSLFVQSEIERFHPVLRPLIIKMTQEKAEGRSVDIDEIRRQIYAALESLPESRANVTYLAPLPTTCSPTPDLPALLKAS